MRNGLAADDELTRGNNMNSCVIENDVIEAACLSKERLVMLTPHADDITPMIFVDRDDQQWLFVAEHVDRDEGLSIVSAAVPGLLADAVTFVVDAHYSMSMTNPRTGRPWGPNEMQAACDHHDGYTIGVTADCLMLVRHERNGLWSQLVRPYHIDKRKRCVHWLDPMSENDTTTMTGFVPDVILESFKAPSAALAINMDQALVDVALPEMLIEALHVSVAHRVRPTSNAARN
jgi:hypothetical protein